MKYFVKYTKIKNKQFELHCILLLQDTVKKHHKGQKRSKKNSKKVYKKYFFFENTFLDYMKPF